MKIKLKEFFYLANLLSIARIILIFPIVYLIKVNTPAGNIWLAFLAFIIILTDFLDGYFSRKFNQVTELGIVLDPIADKLSMAAILVAMIVYRNFPLSLVIFLIYRDVLIMVIGSIAIRKTSKPTMANFWGKLNTSVIAFTGFLFLINFNNIFFTFFLFASYLCLLISGVSYYLIGERLLFDKKIPKYLFRLVIFSLTIAVVYYTFQLDITSEENPALQVEEQFEERTSLIEQYAPVIYFAGEEALFPIEIKSFFDHSALMRSSFCFFFDDKIAEKPALNIDLSRYDQSYYLELDENNFDGIIDYYAHIQDEYKRTIYANVFKIQTEGSTEYIVQYWFFFWGSTLGSTGLMWHACDWEMIMIHLDQNFTPVRAGYSQHYYGETRSWDQVNLENGRPVVYVSKGGHSLHYESGTARSYLDNSKVVPLGSDFCAADIRWTTDEYKIIEIDSSTGWVAYSGYWGRPITTKLPGPKYRNPKDKDLAMWQNPLGWLNKYENKRAR